MMIVQDHVRNTAAGVAVVQSPDELHRISDAACPCVIWTRPPVATFQSWIDTLAPERLPNMRLILRPGQVRSAVTIACDTAKTPICAEHTRLVDDIAILADTFATIMGSPFLRLRLDLVNTDACRKFHVDTLTARLICTYRGAGTQLCTWQNSEAPTKIFRVPTADPIVIRGTLWPEQPASGLRHRSPPIEGTGQTRLVLVLDPIFDASGVA
jgi:hypothetical protein